MTVRRHTRLHTRGRPSALTACVEQRIIDVVGQGNHLNAACEAAGVARSTVYGWLRRADAAAEQVEEGAGLAPLDQACLDFSAGLEAARARAAMRAVAAVMAAIRGGAVISERPLLTKSGVPVRDRDGSLLYRRTYSQPDGRLALAFLARSLPDRWGPSASAEAIDLPRADRVRDDMPSPEDIRRLRDRLYGVNGEPQDLG
jgi:hypothetical protein